jgi:hypothetical protein
MLCMSREITSDNAMLFFPSQGHLGESPFEAGSWTKSQFVAQASPWQPALRGSHGRVNVSAVLIQEFQCL